MPPPCWPPIVSGRQLNGRTPRKAAHYRRRQEMTYTAQASKTLGLRRSAARKARVALAATAVAAAFVVPPLVAGLVAPPAQAATTTTFGNPSQIQIEDNGPANPYPSHVGAQNLLGNV